MTNRCLKRTDIISIINTDLFSWINCPFTCIVALQAFMMFESVLINNWNCLLLIRRLQYLSYCEICQHSSSYFLIVHNLCCLVVNGPLLYVSHVFFCRIFDYFSIFLPNQSLSTQDPSWWPGYQYFLNNFPGLPCNWNKANFSLF